MRDHNFDNLSYDSWKAALERLAHATRAFNERLAQLALRVQVPKDPAFVSNNHSGFHSWRNWTLEARFKRVG